VRLAGLITGVAALLSAPTLAAANCPIAAPMAAAGDYQLSYTLTPALPTVGQPFQMMIQACGPANSAYTGPILVDADMPAHRHSMNYKPSVISTAPGTYVAEGFLLHMPGDWRFKFRLAGANGPVRLAHGHVQP
jgi:hypothetical protein